MKLLPKHGNFLKIVTHLSHLYPLQVENCGSNSRLVVDEDDDGKFRIERVKRKTYHRDCPRDGLLKVAIFKHTHNNLLDGCKW